MSGVREGARRATDPRSGSEAARPSGPRAEGSPQFSGTIRPRNRGNFVGACAKQNSRRLYFESFVEHSFIEHVRSSE